MPNTNIAHALACSLAFAIPEMSKGSLRDLAISRLHEYTNITHTEYLLDWAGLQRDEAVDDKIGWDGVE